MDINTLPVIKDGDSTPPPTEAPSAVQFPKQKLEGSLKKKRRRGKYKRKLLKPFVKLPWQERRKNENSKRNNRFRKIVLSKTHAPFNNNQFLMEIHKPEPENNFEILRTPSARTRDSSFSVDSEENYFYSLPEDEEEYLTKEFSSVYEDAQSERLLNMSKNDLIQEYLLLEAKYDNLVKRTERSKTKYYVDDDKTAMITDKEASITDQDSMITERDTSATSIESSTIEDPSVADVMQRIKEQEEKILELQLANDKLRLENEHLKQKHDSGSEDSESDSSSTSMSSSSSSSSNKSHGASTLEATPHCNNEIADSQTAGDTDQSQLTNGVNGTVDELNIAYPLMNGFHSPSDA